MRNSRIILCTYVINFVLKKSILKKISPSKAPGTRPTVICRLRKDDKMDSINANKQRGSPIVSRQSASNTSYISGSPDLRGSPRDSCVHRERERKRKRRARRMKERKKNDRLGWGRWRKDGASGGGETRYPCRRGERTAKAADVSSRSPGREIYFLSRNGNVRRIFRKRRKKGSSLPRDDVYLLQLRIGGFLSSRRGASAEEESVPADLD